jgi:hypothetical protein
VHRGPISEERWDFDEGLGDEDGDGVEVTGFGAQSQTLSFERNGAPATKRIE